MPIIYALERPKQVELHSDSQDSLHYKVKPCLNKTTEKYCFHY